MNGSNNRGRGFSLIFLVTALVMSLPAQASLIGDQINGCMKNPGVAQCALPVGGDGGFFSSSTATVTDPGVEFSLLTDYYDVLVDFQASSFTISIVNKYYTSGIPFSSQLSTYDDLDFAGSPGGIIGLIERAGGTIPIVSTSFGPHSILVEQGQVPFTTIGEVFSTTFDIVTDSAIPEPATLALMGLGLVGIGFAGKKKRA